MENETFQHIYNSFYSVVYRICLGYVKGDRDMTADLCQEVFINIWEHYDSFKKDSTLSTWVYRIAINCCLNELRRTQNRIQRDHAYETPLSDSAEKQQADQNVLMQCIDNLCAADKIIAILLLEGLSGNEIAQIIETSNANVRVKIHRIKEKLHEIYLSKVKDQ